MTTSAEKNDKKSSHLKYGEGQREQYGEGTGNRAENLNEGADASTDSGWAGGEHDNQKAATTDRPPEAGKTKAKP